MSVASVNARISCPWLSEDESLGLPLWMLESLTSATAEEIRGRMTMMSDRYFMSLLDKRLTQLQEAQS